MPPVLTAFIVAPAMLLLNYSTDRKTTVYGTAHTVHTAGVSADEQAS
jgi:hypothetical protein